MRSRRCPFPLFQTRPPLAQARCQERGRRGHAAARLRTARRPLQLGGNLLIPIGRGLRQMPGPPVRIELRVGHLGQGRVQLLPLVTRDRRVAVNEILVRAGDQTW